MKAFHDGIAEVIGAIETQEENQNGFSCLWLSIFIAHNVGR
jgi:hypothetical protein